MTETKTKITLLEGWTARAERAAEAAREAQEAIRQLEEEKPWLAVSATEGDEGAHERLVELDAQIAGKRKEAEVAEIAEAEARRIVEGERQRVERERAQAEEEGKRARYDEIAVEREKVEALATTALLDLQEALDELAELDNRQRVAARAADVQDALNRGPWKLTTALWLGAHLHEHAPDLFGRPEYRKPLSELNPMPYRAMTPEAKDRLAADREPDHAERKAEGERALRAYEWVQAVENRRLTLLAGTGYDQAPPAVKEDIERQIERDLEREFGSPPGA